MHCTDTIESQINVRIIKYGINNNELNLRKQGTELENNIRHDHINKQDKI